MSKVYTDNIEKRTGGTAMAVPATGKWPTANIADDAIGADQLAGNSVVSASIVDGSIVNADINASADIAGTKLADNAVTLAKMEDGTQGDILYYGASGAPTRLGFGTSGHFLKTQGTGANPVWASAGGDNTPAFMAYQGTTVTGLTDGTEYKVPMDTEIFDTDSAFDHTTNYRFTVPAGEGGKYSIFASSYMGMGRVWNYGGLKIYVNGSVLMDAGANWDGYAENFTAWITTILDLSAADYVEVYSSIDTTDGSNWSQYNGTRASVFGGYKLIV